MILYTNANQCKSMNIENHQLLLAFSRLSRRLPRPKNPTLLQPRAAAPANAAALREQIRSKVWLGRSVQPSGVEVVRNPAPVQRCWW